MPVIDSSYRAPSWLQSGHLQTVLPVLRPRWQRLRPQPERLELPDGDFVDLDWHRAGHGRLVILSHGLEGSARAVYMGDTARVLLAAGWDVLAWSYRGCSGEPNRLARSYHSGESGDLRRVVEHAAAAYPVIALVGFSLGGNITLKCLGEAPAPPPVIAAVAVSSPVDLASSARALDERPDNRLYLRRFLATLVAKTEAKARRFPGRIDAAGLRRLTTIREFDERVTAPLHGFRDAEDYWARASARPHLPAITVPVLQLSARNDPLLAPPSFPAELAQASARYHLELPAHGGHVAFLNARLRPWYPQRLAAWLSGVCADAAAGRPPAAG